MCAVYYMEMSKSINKSQNFKETSKPKNFTVKLVRVKAVATANRADV